MSERFKKGDRVSIEKLWGRVNVWGTVFNPHDPDDKGEIAVRLDQTIAGRELVWVDGYTCRKLTVLELLADAANEGP